MSLKPLSDKTKLRVSELVCGDAAGLGTIYYIICPEMIRVKVGFTTGSPEKRLAALQTGASTKLRIITSHPGTMDDERSIHQDIRASNTHGEWFDLDGPVAELVAFACFAKISAAKLSGDAVPANEVYWLTLIIDELLSPEEGSVH